MEIKTKYGDVFDYLDWRGDLSFKASGLNVIDALIFSILTYVDYSIGLDDKGQTRSLSEYYDYISKNDVQDYIVWILKHDIYLAFFKKLVKTKRYKNIKIYNYVEQSDDEYQFSAVTFILPDNSAFVAYRGTDNTMMGWKEDFNMSFMKETGGQLAASKYVEDIMRSLSGTVNIGGHSKGGNFAVYAGVRVPLKYKDRIGTIFNFDGPGFTSDFFTSVDYLQTEPKIVSFVPESSIVGVLLSYCPYVTIRSTNQSLLQHDPFSWEIIGKRFNYNDERTKSSKILEQSISKMLSSLSNEEKEVLVDEIFKVIDGGDIETTEDFTNNLFKHLLFTMPKLIVKVQKYGLNKMKNRGEDNEDTQGKLVGG